MDVEFMRRLHHKVNIIPVIGKSDACTREELAVFKRRILAQLAEHQIQVLDMISIILNWRVCFWKINALNYELQC